MRGSIASRIQWTKSRHMGQSSIHCVWKQYKVENTKYRVVPVMLVIGNLASSTVPKTNMNVMEMMKW